MSNSTEILIDSDGIVRGGTVTALVERLTTHEHEDPTFNKTFLTTYKSFTNLDNLLDLLVKRFYIQTPDGLKQHAIQMRVVDTLKSLVADNEMLEKEDMPTLDRIRDFVVKEEVVKYAGAKEVLVLIERAQRGSDTDLKTTANATLPAPPAPIKLKTNKELTLLDVDALELARQLTILESQLYQKIGPLECLQRSVGQQPDHDNIQAVIEISNQIANWVAETVLSKEDPKKRADILKQFISVADHCRQIQNYSTMVAIASGINSPPIRRLKRTVERIDGRSMKQLAACESFISANRDYVNYHNTMAKVSPPCVPFIGVFLTTPSVAEDDSHDALPDNFIDFYKLQTVAEVIQDIKRWQSPDYNFSPLPDVLAYLNNSLNQFNDHKDDVDRLWNLSLQREPEEQGSQQRGDERSSWLPSLGCGLFGKSVPGDKEKLDKSMGKKISHDEKNPVM